MLDALLGLLQQSPPSAETKFSKSLLRDLQSESLLADDKVASMPRMKPAAETVPMDTIEKTLKEEGGYQNLKRDKGNWTGGKVGKGKQIGTNYGITPISWAEYTGQNINSLNQNSMKNITKEQAKDFYNQKAEKEFKMYRYPDNLKDQIFDIMVQHGYTGGMKILQKSAGAEADGLYGPSTKQAIQNLSNKQLADTRLKSYGEGFIKNFPGVVGRAKRYSKL
tara:strand:+ start:1210 stop:1875 length:666 start_codon:yes stop_codon:yes gene_type:complete